MAKQKATEIKDYRQSQEYLEYVFTLGFKGESVEKLIAILKKFVYPEYSLEFINGITNVINAQWTQVQEAKQTKKKTK